MTPSGRKRDRLILSKGHCAVGVYPILADKGYFPKEWLDHYALIGSPLGDHPDMTKVPGSILALVRWDTVFPLDLGWHWGLRWRKPANSSYGRAFVLLGDGELNEGQIWEAAQAAGHYQVGNLIGIIDRNGMGLDGMTQETLRIEPLAARSGGPLTGMCRKWMVTIYRHWSSCLICSDPNADKPQMIIAHTIKGKGVTWMENSRVWHLGYLAGVDAQQTIDDIKHYPWNDSTVTTASERN